MYLMPKAWVSSTLTVHLTDTVGKTGKPRCTRRMLLLLSVLSVLAGAGKAFLTAAFPSALPERVQILDPHCTELEGAPAMPSTGSRVSPEALRVLFSRQRREQVTWDIVLNKHCKKHSVCVWGAQLCVVVAVTSCE